MCYTRSSFVRYLTGKRNCEIINHNDRKSRVITIIKDSATAYIMTSKKDIISYTEIYIVCEKLGLDLPGDSDLERIG